MMRPTTYHLVLDSVEGSLYFHGSYFPNSTHRSMKSSAFDNTNLLTWKSKWGGENGGRSGISAAKHTLITVYISYAQNFHIATKCFENFLIILEYSYIFILQYDSIFNVCPVNKLPPRTESFLLNNISPFFFRLPCIRCSFGLTSTSSFVFLFPIFP